MNNQSMEKIKPFEITIRPFELTDVDDFFLWAGDDRVTKYLRWETITSKDEASAFVKDVCIPHPWRRSICLNDRSIGFISAFREPGDDRFRSHFGYAVSREHWGKGIATKAVKMAVNQVFKDYPDLVRLQAMVNAENKASQRVLEKCLFHKEGLLRQYECIKGQLQDLYMYSILSTDLLPTVDS